MERYDALVFVATEKGACAKIIGGRNPVMASLHYCGRPLSPGTANRCERHQHD